MDAPSKDPDNDPNKLVIVEEFLLEIECSNHGQPEILETAINIDLAEFDFTPQELEKVRKLFQKLNFALSDAFSKICPAASVMTEIRSK
jgi:hypothetical protein